MVLISTDKIGYVESGGDLSLDQIISNKRGRNRGRGRGGLNRQFQQQKGNFKGVQSGGITKKKNKISQEAIFTNSTKQKVRFYIFEAIIKVLIMISISNLAGCQKFIFVLK